jgi:hypothetical protein
MPTGPGPGRVIANPIGVAWLGDPEESPVGVALLRVDSLDVLGAVVRQAEVIMAASAPAGGALVASRPAWTPVVAASETPVTRPSRMAIRRSGSRSSSEVDSTSRGTTSRA